jgi:hypothetical protein
VEVVPDVNWMFITSLFERCCGGSARGEGLLRRSTKDVLHLNALGSTRPDELSTRITLFRLGTVGDSRFGLVRLGTSCWNSGTLERGLLKGRLVSVLMIKCEASR